MKATHNPQTKTKFVTSFRKENHLHTEYAMIVPSTYRKDETHTVVTLRIYWPGTVAYAALWVHGKEIHASGTGRAGGGGYCKQSAAAYEAIRNAGFTLSKSISGVGTGAIEDAVKAIARAVGYPKARLHVAHG